MGQFSNSFPKHFSYLCEYAFRFDLSCGFCEYPFIFHCLHCSPSCFDPDSLLLAHFWLGLSWIDYISANKRFSSSKTSSRKSYTYSKHQEKQKHSAETTINFSSQVWANVLAFLQSALDSGVVPIRGASRRCTIFCGGDSPWLRRLSGVTTHWMAGSLFSYMTWCKSSATWLQQDVDRTTERDEQLLGLIAPGAKCRPMDIFGVVQRRLLKVPLRRRHLIPCVLHLLIFVGRQVTALVRRLAKSVRPSTRVSVQAILHRSGCHIALQGTVEPDGEETWCLLKVWEDLAPLLGGDMRMHTAVVAMYILLGDMYGTMFEEGALQAPEVAQAFQRWVCAAIRSPYINWMLHDVTVTIQAIRPYGLGMFSGDLLEGSNRVLKDIWSSFCDRGGGAGTLVSRRIKMLRQVNQRLFLYFEVPRWNGTSRSNLCNAQKMADEVRAYFADEELW